MFLTYCFIVFDYIKICHIYNFFLSSQKNYKIDVIFITDEEIEALTSKPWPSDNKVQNLLAIASLDITVRKIK